MRVERHSDSVSITAMLISYLWSSGKKKNVNIYFTWQRRGMFGRGQAGNPIGSRVAGQPRRTGWDYFDEVIVKILYCSLSPKHRSDIARFSKKLFLWTVWSVALHVKRRFYRKISQLCVDIFFIILILSRHWRIPDNSNDDDDTSTCSSEDH